MYCLFGALLLFAMAGFVLLPGCSLFPAPNRVRTQIGESIVLAGEQPAQLAFSPLHNKRFHVRSTYRDNLPATIQYEEGRDYVVDYRHGQIRRTAQSRIPDFRTNMLFGVEDFDHGKFPGFGNTKFFAYVDYDTKTQEQWPRQLWQGSFLSKTSQKLIDHKSVKIVAFGDSITAGGEASEPDLIFWQRWAKQLQMRYPQAHVEAINGATGGDTTVQGLARLDEKVLSQHPDLVLIGFGMNDHNVPGFGTPLDQFSANLATMIDRIRAGGAEIILYSTFPPNPKWHYGSHNMEAYALATERVAREKGCAYADVYHNWVTMAARKKPEDLLGNNINHPNDFGHWIYFAVLRQIGL